MHIMHVIDSLAPGGAERMAVDCANQASTDDHQVSFCVTRREDTLAGELSPEISYTNLGRTRRFDWPAMRHFASVSRNSRVELFHAHGRTTFSFLALMKALGMVQGAILLHDHQNVELDAHVPFWLRVWGRRYLSAYVGVYQKLHDWARAAGIKPEIVEIIGNALDLKRVYKAHPLDLRTEFGLPNGKRIGIVVGGIRPDKGIHVMLEGIARSASRNRITLLIVGGVRDQAYWRRCQADSRKHGLDDVVRFVGERSDVLGLVKGADFAMIPSIAESGPLVLIEYLAARLPVIGTLVGDIAVRTQASGLDAFVQPNDPAAISRQLDELLALSPQQLNVRSELGHRIATELFDIRKVMPRWYELYHRAVIDVRR